MAQLHRLLLLLGIVGCSEVEVRRQPRDPGPDPGPTEPTEPAARTVEVRVIAAHIGAPVAGIEVLSNTAAGPVLERATTDADGVARLEVETGGTVSIFNNELRPVVWTYRVTEALTVVTHPLLTSPPPPNAPFDIVFDVQQVPGATKYAATLSCRDTPVIVETEDLPIVVQGYEGCPGIGTYSALVTALVDAPVLDHPATVVGHATVANAPLPSGGSVTHAVAPAPLPEAAFSLTFDVPVGSYVAGKADYGLGVPNWPSWGESRFSTASTPTVFPVSVGWVELPLELWLEAELEDDDGTCREARRLERTAERKDIEWNPRRLASLELVDDAIAFGEGDAPDWGKVRMSDGSSATTGPWAEIIFPWQAEEEGRVPSLPELPDDLASQYAFEPAGFSTAVLDTQNATYELVLAQGLWPDLAPYTPTGTVIEHLVKGSCED